MSVHLSPPWITLYHMVSKLFEHDSEVKVMYDEDTYTIKLFVDN